MTAPGFRDARHEGADPVSKTFHKVFEKFEEASLPNPARPASPVYAKPLGDFLMKRIVLAAATAALVVGVCRAAI